MPYKPTPVPADLLARLRQLYGPREDAAIKPQKPAGFDAEKQVIKENKKHPNAVKQHPFRPAQFVEGDNGPACLMCGNDEPVGGVCNSDQPMTTSVTGPNIIPVAAADENDAAKIAAGIDAGVDQALVLLRSTPDLPDYAAQARDVLQGIEPACDALLDYFGVTDPDDANPETAAFPKTQKCKFCDNQATKRVIHSEGMAYVPTCDTHLADAKDAAATCTPDGTRDESNINAVRDVVQQAFYTSPVTFTPKLERPAFLPESKAFVEEINGKTILTTQAATELAGSMTNHDHFLWTQGRLVGADEPNRNGAFWTSGDLELGQTTVPYGPLNWLHEEKHVIGTIAAASYSTAEKAADTAQNHIAIAAPIWRWLYPDEAAVVEMASEAGKFWYSMECISREVQCVGDTGCGAQVSYFDYMQQAGATCEHMIQRSAVRRLVDPIFLGAAVIIPPVRPGWADADATVARQAASLAEHTFDAAGRPDMSASEWERLMAQVVRFATS